MNDEMNDFLFEGMKRYGEAAKVMVKFGKTIEAQLKEILDSRKNWGEFTPVADAKAKSTTYWSEYPLLNSRINAKWNDKEVLITIAINWYKTNTDYPYYAVWLEQKEQSIEYVSNIMIKSNNIEAVERELRLYPNPNDFNLERDFNRLLDVFLGI